MSEEDVEKLFTGISSMSLDSKVRIAIPAKFRKIIEERNPNGNPEKRHCVWIVTDIRKDKPYLACFDNRDWKRNWLYIPGAEVEKYELDRQGRIVLTDRLVSHAHITKEVEDDIIIAGSPSQKHFELWKKDYFEVAYKTEMTGPKIWEM